MKTPVARRKVLVLLAGILWSAVGIGMTSVAMKWMLVSEENILPYAFIGVFVGFLAYRFGFQKLALINLQRIFTQTLGKNKVCLFAFQNRRSYFIMLSMMFLGFTMRHLPISKIYLAPMYMTIGLGLFLASLHYYFRLGK